MNSFDSLIERYKKELIDAKKRSIAQQLKEAETEEISFPVSAEVKKNEEKEPKTVFASAMTEDKQQSAEEEAQEDESIIDAEPPAAEQFANTEFVEPSRNEPQSLGSLKVQVFMAGRAYPVSSANVIITGQDGKVYFDGFTDTNGAISRLLLPAPKKQLSQSPQLTPPYAQYDIFVSHPRFQSRKYIGVPVFSGVESIQNIQLLPLGTDISDNTDVQESEPNGLLMKGGENNA